MGGDSRLRGLTDLVQYDDLELRDCLVRWKVNGDQQIMMLPAGSRLAPGAGLFRKEAFAKVMTEIRDTGALVLLDSPPILAAAETLDIAAQVDGILLVVEQGASLQALDEARARLEMTGKPLLGYVFNRATYRSGGYGKYYMYGYGYGQER